MFIIYKSNELNILLSKVYEIIQKKPLKNILKKEIFIHDNKVLFQYLNIFITKKIGSSENFKLYHPYNFIWKLFQKIFSKKKIKNMFTQPIMIWKIMQIIEKNNIFEDFKKTKNNIDKFKFSLLMSKIFEKYLLYRPHWINAWEMNNNISNMNSNEIWQIELWIEIIKNTKENHECSYHFAKLFYIFLSLMHQKKVKKFFFPQRIFIMSSFALNPTYIKFFKIISSYTKIYFLYMTPCKNNVFNVIKKDKLILKKNIVKTQIVNNCLIKLWGQYEKIYILYILQSKKIKIINAFKKNKNYNLLNSIQNDLLKLKTSKNHKVKKRLLTLQDHSISINIFYNKQDEIATLHKKLLVLFHENPKIKVCDVVVTSFSLEKYVSYINSIFTSSNHTTQIPFFISQKFSKNTAIILSTFNKILNLSYSRFTNEEILELLDIPEIAKNFNILEEEINILYHWIDEANIRWALDSEHKDFLSFPNHNQNTWLYGIEKLILSYAMNNTKNIWNNILSCSIINGSRAELVGKLIIFINILKKWKKKLSIPRTVQYWRTLSQDLISDFFYHSENIEQSISIIQQTWIEMINDILSSNYPSKISIDILKKNFFYKSNLYYNQKILPGVLNFCHPSAICYIPFKIICMIGFDQKNIPQRTEIDNFDLLKKYSSTGDIDLYQKYFYLFLQNFSCTKKYLYISYIGYSIKNNYQIYPSIIIDQLLNYIALHFCFINDQNLSLKDNKKKIIAHLCRTYQRNSIYEKKCIKNSLTKNVQHTCNYQDESRKIFYSEQLLKINNFYEINLENLIYFWKNPIRYFCNLNLKIKDNLYIKKFDTTEPFYVDIQESWKIKNILLDTIIKNQDVNKIFEYYVLSGKLPYHFFGELFWNETIQSMKSIAKLVIKYRTFTEEKQIDLKIKKYHIKGILSEIQSTGLLRWKPYSINYSDRISLWLEHLVYSALGGHGESKIIGDKNKIWSFSSLNSDIAYNYLFKYIEGYIQGIKTPLLLIRSGAVWLDQIYDRKNNCIKNDNITQKKAYKKFIENWMGNNYIKGEKQDFYIQQIITSLNKKNIKEICQIAKDWLIPILKNKKNKSIIKL